MTWLGRSMMSCSPSTGEACSRAVGPLFGEREAVMCVHVVSLSVQSFTS